MSVGSFNDFKWEVWKNLMVQFWSMFKLENFGLNAQSENQILKGHIPCNLQKSIILRQFVAVHIFLVFTKYFSTLMIWFSSGENVKLDLVIRPLFWPEDISMMYLSKDWCLSKSDSKFDMISA